MRNVNVEHRENLSSLERFATAITNRIGTMGFFILIVLWTVCWFAWNTWGPVEMRFDPLPGFVIWLFISNVIQIFLMPLIMVAQNLQSRHAEARAEADYEVNVKSEKQIETMVQLLQQILKK